MTHLRNMMLEELQRRNYSQSTARAYIRAVRDFTEHFHQSPDQLGPEHLRQFQAHLFRDRKLEARTVVQYSAALRFFFVKTLKRQLPDGEHPAAKGAVEATDRAEPAGGDPAHRLGQQPDASCHSDDALLDRYAGSRVVPPESERYR